MWLNYQNECNYVSVPTYDNLICNKVDYFNFLWYWGVVN